MSATPSETVICITHLRECLGIAYQHVVNNDEPIVVQRYAQQGAMLVPAWEWRFLKELEAGIKAGQCPVAKEKGVTCPCMPQK